jgi:hypothetical protein
VTSEPGTAVFGEKWMIVDSKALPDWDCSTFKAIEFDAISQVREIRYFLLPVELDTIIAYRNSVIFAITL